MIRIKKMVILAFLTCFASAYAQRSSFNSSWNFIQKDIPGAENVDFQDKDWRVLNLPHDWSIEGEYAEKNPMGNQCGYLPVGIGWYRKTITVPKAWKGKQVEIAFDAVCMNSTVWANGRKLGYRPMGWISFSYDISSEVQNSNTITFAVRVDNDKQPSARWYTGSGIYANTWIDVNDPVHVANNGIFIKTKGGVVEIETDLVNINSRTKKVTLKTSVVNDAGVVQQYGTQQMNIKANANSLNSQKLLLKSPKLWSPESPTLYTLITEIFIGKNKVDEVKTRFGFRDIQWIPETGMWLNGKNIKLQGVCNHNDAGALGVAVPDKILRFRIQQMKDMGVNAIRTAHNPQTPQFYDMCDEMGMMVMDELFDGWKKKADNDYGAHAFNEWWNRDLTDWIKRDRNHASVVIYSVGNETEGEIGKDLVARCHELDNTRPVTSGHSGSEYMDVLGVNGHSEKMGWFDEMPKDRVFIGTENTHTWQVRGYYRTKTWFRDGYPNERQKPYPCPDLTEKEVFTYDWADAATKRNGNQDLRSSYDNAMVRVTSRLNIAQLRDIPNYAGSFRWTGYDYIGETKYQGGWPFKGFVGGAVDMANFEKDLYYLYQSQWTTKPMLHILPHWTHPTLTEGTEIPIWVYSNCETVELFFNGQSLGKQNPGKQWDKMQCEWMVGWKAGEIKAIGYKNGKAITEQIIRSADRPAKIQLSVDGEALAKTGEDIVQLRVTTTDEKGEFYPYGENRSYFHVIGPGRIRALDNGSPMDVEKHYQATDRTAFFGLTRAYIESTEKEGDVAVLVSCILGEKKLITSTKISIDTKLLALRGKLPTADVKVFYTTDGSEPTSQSTPYTQSFDIHLGTTVKALVLLNGEKVNVLTERFAANEGMVWESSAKAGQSLGAQAEDAKFEGAQVANQLKGFNGKGYLMFKNNNPKAFVDFYHENDGSAGKAKLKIRYNTNSEKDNYLKLMVNDKVLNEKMPLNAIENPGSVWRTFTVPIKLNIGANNVRLTNSGNFNLAVDEITIE